MVCLLFLRLLIVRLVRTELMFNFHVLYESLLVQAELGTFHATELVALRTIGTYVRQMFAMGTEKSPARSAKTMRLISLMSMQRLKSLEY